MASVGIECMKVVAAVDLETAIPVVSGRFVCILEAHRLVLSKSHAAAADSVGQNTIEFGQFMDGELQIAGHSDRYRIYILEEM